MRRTSSVTEEDRENALKVRKNAFKSNGGMFFYETSFVYPVMMTPFQRNRPLGHRSLLSRRIQLSHQGERHHVEHFRKSLCAKPNYYNNSAALDLTILRRTLSVTYLQALHHKSKPNLHFLSRMRILNEPNQCCYNQFVTLASQCGVRSGTDFVQYLYHT